MKSFMHIPIVLTKFRFLQSLFVSEYGLVVKNYFNKAKYKQLIDTFSPLSRIEFQK